MSRAQAANTGHPFIHSHMDCENVLAPGPQASIVCIFFILGFLERTTAHSCGKTDWWHSTSQTVIEKVLVKDLMDRQSV